MGGGGGGGHRSSNAAVTLNISPNACMRAGQAALWQMRGACCHCLTREEDKGGEQRSIAKADLLPCGSRCMDARGGKGGAGQAAALGHAWHPTNRPHVADNSERPEQNDSWRPCWCIQARAAPHLPQRALPQAPHTGPQPQPQHPPATKGPATSFSSTSSWKSMRCSCSQRSAASIFLYMHPCTPGG